MKEKKKRNLALIAKRTLGWSYGKLAKHYKISRATAYHIVMRGMKEDV